MSTEVKPVELFRRAAEIAHRAFPRGDGPAKLIEELAARAPHKSIRLEDENDDGEVLLAVASLLKRPVNEGGMGIPDGGPALVLEHLAHLPGPRAETG